MPVKKISSEVLTHTYPFNGPLSGTTRVSRYKKGKTNLDFTKARDSEWQWHQLGHMQVCTSLQTDKHASTTPLSFYRPDALPAAQPTASKHWSTTENYWNLEEIDGKPVGERLRPSTQDERPHAQTNGQPENIMPPAQSIGGGVNAWQFPRSVYRVARVGEKNSEFSRAVNLLFRRLSQRK